jgi:hypothetical protein
MSSVCIHASPENDSRVFCVDCGRLVSQDRLRSVKLMGAIGPRHTSNENVQRFLATGNPDYA